jgi:signal transduction histidine kinase
LRVYEPADISFASTFAVLCLGSLMKIKLIKADTAKTAFVSMISHELRTPLHGLLSQLELIREFAPKEFIEETDSFLQTAEVCGLTLRDVVSSLIW